LLDVCFAHFFIGAASTADLGVVECLVLNNLLNAITVVADMKKTLGFPVLHEHMHTADASKTQANIKQNAKQTLSTTASKSRGFLFQFRIRSHTQSI